MSSTQTYGFQGTDPLGITLTASGQVIPGVAGKRIRVFAWFASTLLATSIKFQSNATDISGTFACADKGGHVIPHVNLAWMVTSPGESLNLNMTVATTVGLQVIYDIVE
jgi:hypothetical protein